MIITFFNRATFHKIIKTSLTMSEGQDNTSNVTDVEVSAFSECSFFIFFLIYFSFIYLFIFFFFFFFQEKRGFKLVTRFGQVSDDSFELSFLYDRTMFDVFFFVTEGNTTWNGGFIYRQKLK